MNPQFVGGRARLSIHQPSTMSYTPNYEHYTILIDALKSLRAKRLTRGSIYDARQDCPCALGAIVMHRYPEAEDFPSEDLLDSYESKMQREGYLGDAAYSIIEENDDYEGTPEERYEHMLWWAEEIVEAFSPITTNHKS